MIEKIKYYVLAILTDCRNGLASVNNGTVIVFWWSITFENILELDQAQQNVGRDLDTNYLQRLSANGVLNFLGGEWFWTYPEDDNKAYKISQHAKTYDLPII